MKVTIIYGNKVYKKGLAAGWGFSCLVQVEDNALIFRGIAPFGRKVVYA